MHDRYILITDFKTKVASVHVLNAYWGLEVKLCALLTLVLDGSALAAFSLGKECLISTEY